MKRKNITIAACTLLLGMTTAFPLTGHAFSEGDLASAYGKPDVVVKVDTHSEIHTYRCSLGTVGDIYRVFEVKDGRVIDKGLSFFPDGRQ